VSDIRVLIDQTARVDAALASETIAGQAVSIVAERKVVKKDVATSVASVSSQELATLPFNSVSEVGLQAGVEGPVVRSGADRRSSLDGVTLRDPRNNSRSPASLSAIRNLGGKADSTRNTARSVGHRERGDKGRQAGIPKRHLGLRPGRKYFGAESGTERLSSPFVHSPCSSVPRSAVCWPARRRNWVYTQRQYPQFGDGTAFRALMTDGTRPMTFSGGGGGFSLAAQGRGQ
jgi:hypothetical protein